MIPLWLLAPPAGLARSASSTSVQLPEADPVGRTDVDGAVDLLAVVVAAPVGTVVVLVIEAAAVLTGVAVAVGEAGGG